MGDSVAGRGQATAGGGAGEVCGDGEGRCVAGSAVVSGQRDAAHADRAAARRDGGAAGARRGRERSEPAEHVLVRAGTGGGRGQKGRGGIAGEGEDREGARTDRPADGDEVTQLARREYTPGK